MTNFRKLFVRDKIVDKLGDVLVPEANVPMDQRLAKLSDYYLANIQEIENKAIVGFVGQMDQLESVGYAWACASYGKEGVVHAA